MSKHGLKFSIEGVDFTVEELGDWVSQAIAFRSEYDQECFAHDAVHAIMHNLKNKVVAVKERESRVAWEQRHPPNHAGFYYCHICGGWVRREEAELDHVIPTSVITGDDPDRDDNRRMAHKYPQYNLAGEKYCIGNQEKGSQIIKSKTMEIAPPDEEV